MKPIIKVNFNEEVPTIPTQIEVQQYSDDFFWTPNWFQKEYAIAEAPQSYGSNKTYFRTIVYGDSTTKYGRSFIYVPQDYKASLRIDIQGKNPQFVHFKCTSIDEFQSLIKLLNHQS